MFYLIFYCGKVIGGASWELAVMRGLVLFAFFVSAALAAELGRMAMPVAPRRWVVLLCALSIQIARTWTTQLRGDYFAIALNLLAMVCLSVESRTPTLVAVLGGIAAGFAPGIKFSYIAGGVSGLIWLIATRQWRRAAAFGGAAFLTALAVYGAAIWREPMMLRHTELFGRILITDYAGIWPLWSVSLCDPILLGGLATAIVLGCRNMHAQVSVLYVYVMVTGAIALLGAAHVGANTNYFLEVAIALAPFAALCVVWIWRMAGRTLPTRSDIRMSLCFGVLIFFLFVLCPFIQKGVTDMYSAGDRIHEKNKRFQTMQELRGLRVLSFFGDATMASGARQMEDPFAFSLFVAGGVLDPEPIVREISSDEFDVLVGGRGWYRGVPIIAARLTPVIAAHYVPACEISGAVLLVRKVPNGARQELVRAALRRMGCR